MLQSAPATADKVRLRASELRPGMYVCDIDRPWLETPFLLQGFEVKNDTDIRAVMEHCRFVQVDLRRTKSRQPSSAANLGGKAMATAEATRRQTSDLLKTFLDEIAFGHSPDMRTAKSAVAGCVSRVVGNPEAMMFLTRLRGKGEQAGQQAFNVCVYAIVLGRLAGLEYDKLENLGTAALLHDMGVVGIPDPVLNKRGKFNEEERAVMQTHARMGRDILMSGRNIFSGAVDVAYAHHENLDGTGYPRGLHGHQINLNSKIVAVVDKYDALVSHTPYRPAKDHLSAVATLNKMARDNKIDKDLVDLFVSYLGIYPPGCVVELNSGEVGIVLESNPAEKLKPKVMVLRDADQQPTQRLVDWSKKAAGGRGGHCRIARVCKPGDFGIEVGQYYKEILQAYH